LKKQKKTSGPPKEGIFGKVRGLQDKKNHLPGGPKKYTAGNATKGIG